MALFQDIYEKYGRPVYRFLLSLTGDPNQAEELMQETFYQAFLHIEQFEGRSSVYTWLCQIGKNAWLKECRRQKHFTEAEGMPEAVSKKGEQPEEMVIQTEEIRRIRQAVYELEEPYREVFIMHVFGESQLKDIAAAFGKSESWARVTFYRAKNKIAEKAGS